MASAEILLEKIKLKQLVVGMVTYVLGFVTPFAPDMIYYVQGAFSGRVACSSEITIIEPKSQIDVVYDYVELTGTIKGDCKNIYVIVENVTCGQRSWYVTDAITVDPKRGKWTGVANIETIPIGTKARIHARVCANAGVYPPGRCLIEPPSQGTPSNAIIVRRIVK
jgi:hypothetical protein